MCCPFESGHGHEMKLLRRLLLVLVVVALGLTVDYVAHATTEISSPTGKNSCVSSWSGSVGNWTWAANETRVLSTRCFYDPVNAPTYSGITGTHAFFTGTSAQVTTLTTGTNFTLTGSKCDGTALVAQIGLTSGYSFHSLAVVSYDLTDGYVEFTVSVKRWSSTGAAMCDRTDRAGVFWNNNVGGTSYHSGNGSTAAACSSLSAGGCVGTSALSYLNGAEPGYRWTTAAEPFCGAVVTVTDPASLMAQVEPGDTVTFSTAWLSGVTGNVDIQLGGASTVWQNIHTEGTISNPDEHTITIPNAWPYIWRVGAINMRCRDVGLDMFLYADVEDPTTPGDAVGRPCKMARWYWPANRAVAVDEDVTFSLNYSGTLPTGMSPDMTIEYATYDDLSIAHVPVFTGLTWTDVVVDPPLGTLADYDLPAVYAASVRQFVFRCTDSSGTTYAGQWLASIRLDPSDDPDELGSRDSSCYSGAGLGLNPASWVPGFGRILGCMFRALFVPSQPAIDGLVASAQAATDKAPISFIADSGELIYEAANGADSAVTANRNGCIVVLGAMAEIDLPQQSACPSDLDSGALTTARTILGGMFWLFAAWMLWTTTRKLISQ